MKYLGIYSNIAHLLRKNEYYLIYGRYEDADYIGMGLINDRCRLNNDGNFDTYVEVFAYRLDEAKSLVKRNNNDTFLFLKVDEVFELNNSEISQLLMWETEFDT